MIDAAVRDFDRVDNLLICHYGCYVSQSILNDMLVEFYDRVCYHSVNGIVFGGFKVLC